VQGALFKGQSLPLRERKTCLQVAFLMGLPVKSAFALLLTRVTEPRQRSYGHQPNKKGADLMNRTISAMVGKGSVNHNSRVFHAKNTDTERAYLNREYCNDNIKTVYHVLFDEALNRYNDNQTRTDRKIENYYEKISSGKQEKPFHEIILQIGNKDDMNAQDENGQLAAKVLDEYYNGFQARNLNLKVFSTHIHMDEATPHLHIDFVPFITASKRGLDTRVSLKQALSSQGFKGGTRGDTEWNQWVQSEKEQLAMVMERHGIHWEQKGIHQKHLSVLEYEKKMRSQEIAELGADIDDKKVKIDELTVRIDNLLDCENAVVKITENIENDPELQLPEPTTLMSAKAYKTKFVEPLIKKFKNLIKSVLVRYFDLKSDFNRWQKANMSLANDRDKLQIKVENLQDKNSKLEDTVLDYRLLRKVLGNKQVDDILQQAKDLQKSKQRDKSFKDNFER
jgi:hypothetical protein